MRNITNDARSATFLTSTFRSRVVREHDATVDAELRIQCVDGTCRYNDGRTADGPSMITLSRGTPLAQDIGQLNEIYLSMAKT